MQLQELGLRFRTRPDDSVISSHHFSWFFGCLEVCLDPDNTDVGLSETHVSGGSGSDSDPRPHNKLGTSPSETLKFDVSYHFSSNISTVPGHGIKILHHCCEWIWVRPHSEQSEWLLMGSHQDPLTNNGVSYFILWSLRSCNLIGCLWGE